MKFWKALSGLFAGMVAGGCIVAAVEAIGHSVARGDAVFAVAIGGYFLAAMAGSAIASKLAGPKIAVLVPAILGVLATMNMVAFPHPSWFAVAAALALIAGWLAGSALGKPADSRGATTRDG